MGLDITWYTKLKLIDVCDINESHNHELNSDYHYDSGVVYLYANKDFNVQDDIPNGFYQSKISGHFRAGSYGGYNAWRSQLENFADECSDAGACDFESLINYSDCEGFIGPHTSKKLYEDFEKNLEKVKKWSKKLDDDGYFLAKYIDWLNAFKCASDYGAVKFH